MPFAVLYHFHNGVFQSSQHLCLNVNFRQNAPNVFHQSLILTILPIFIQDSVYIRQPLINAFCNGANCLIGFRIVHLVFEKMLVLGQLFGERRIVQITRQLGELINRLMLSNIIEQRIQLEPNNVVLDFGNVLFKVVDGFTWLHVVTQFDFNMKLARVRLHGTSRRQHFVHASVKMGSAVPIAAHAFWHILSGLFNTLLFRHLFCAFDFADGLFNRVFIIRLELVILVECLFGVGIGDGLGCLDCFFGPTTPAYARAVIRDNITLIVCAMNCDCLGSTATHFLT